MQNPVARAPESIDYRRGALGLFAASSHGGDVGDAQRQHELERQLSNGPGVRGCGQLDVCDRPLRGRQRGLTTGDKAAFGGHFYSDKAFGVSLLCVPVYAAMQAVAWLFDFRWDLQVSLYVFRMVSASIPAALSLDPLVAAGAGGRERCRVARSSPARAGVLRLDLVTYRPWPCPTRPGIAMCLAATYLLCHPPAGGLRPGRAAAIGFLCGFAVICRFSLRPHCGRRHCDRVPDAAALGAPRSLARATGSAVVAGALPLGLFAAYSYSIFGTLRSAGNSTKSSRCPGGDVAGPDGHDTSAAERCVGSRLPSVSSGASVALDSHGAGWLRFWHAQHRQSAGVWMDGAVAFASALLMNSSYYMWWGGYTGGAVDAADDVRGAARSWRTVPSRGIPLIWWWALVWYAVISCVLTIPLVLTDPQMPQIEEAARLMKVSLTSALRVPQFEYLRMYYSRRLVQGRRLRAITCSASCRCGDRSRSGDSRSNRRPLARAIQKTQDMKCTKDEPKRGRPTIREANYNHLGDRMRTSDSIVRILASAKRVWLALTVPDLVKHWQYGSDLLTTSERGLTSLLFRQEDPRPSPPDASSGGDGGPDVLSYLKELVEVKMP